jgi:hypothetical protein
MQIMQKEVRKFNFKLQCKGKEVNAMQKEVNRKLIINFNKKGFKNGRI